MAHKIRPISMRGDHNWRHARIGYKITHRAEHDYYFFVALLVVECSTINAGCMEYKFWPASNSYIIKNIYNKQSVTAQAQHSLCDWSPRLVVGAGWLVGRVAWLLPSAISCFPHTPPQLYTTKPSQPVSRSYRITTNNWLGLVLRLSVTICLYKTRPTKPNYLF